MRLDKKAKCRYNNYIPFAQSQKAQIAQLVEQGTENPCVVGSIPTLGTISYWS